MASEKFLRPFLVSTLDRTDFTGLGARYEGKVRDVYTGKDRTILIATDRQSAFDMFWCTIPLKGQILNEISAWWFHQIKDIMPTHVIAVPDPNVMVVKPLKMFAVEIVVRAYLTGSTATSAWVNYRKGVRRFGGNILPDGITKNQRFDSPIVTPTTKGISDEPIEPDAIVARALATPAQWEAIASYALALFARGQDVAARRGLILVDTKYEMGVDEGGHITVADEVHTPDSSRYWVADSYPERIREGQEPESLDKEFFRLWLSAHGFDYGQPKPPITEDVRIDLAHKYMQLYERITGDQVRLPGTTDIIGRIEQNLEAYKN